MFFLRNLPTDNELKTLSKRYPSMEPRATKACIMLMRLGSDLSQILERRLAGDGLSMGRFLCLMVLIRNPEKSLSPSEMADKVGVTRPTMTGLLDGLEKDKLITRFSDAHDRRMLSVKITARGLKQLDKILPKYYRLITEMMSDLKEAETNQLISLLMRAFPEIC